MLCTVFAVSLLCWHSCVAVVVGRGVVDLCGAVELCGFVELCGAVWRCVELCGFVELCGVAWSCVEELRRVGAWSCCVGVVAWSCAVAVRAVAVVTVACYCDNKNVYTEHLE
jgi:hypothetical protein